MSSPQNQFSKLQSPYAHHLSQYPSQAESFLAFDNNGRINSSTPAKYEQNNKQNVNFTNSQNRQNRGRRYFNVGNEGGNCRNNQQNRYSAGNNSNFKQKPYGNTNNYRQQSTLEIIIDQYYHPTMIEDPWKDLMHRHTAITNSRIDIQPEKGEVNYQGKSSKSEDDVKEVSPITVLT